MNNEEVLGLVLKYGGNVNKVTDEGSILHVAIRSDCTNTIYHIINFEHDFDYTLKDEDGVNVLFLCVSSSDAHTFNLLLKKFTDDVANRKAYSNLLNEKNKRGNTLLHELTLDKNYPLLSVLEANKDILGIDLNAKNRNGLTYIELKDKIAKEENYKKYKKAQKVEEERLVRRQKKEELKIEELKMKENERLLEQKLKEKEEEELVKLEQHNNMRKFYCIAFVILFMVALYLFIKVKIETKREYLFN